MGVTEPQAGPVSGYLGGDDVVEIAHPEIRRLAAELRTGGGDVDFARRAFELVRDRVRHSVDAQDPRVTLSASEVLEAGVGLCYAKSHLLVALLRAGCVPAGLCYQRLGDDAGGFALHGLVAVHLDGAWHRLDPRGNRPGIEAEFSLGEERLAYVVDESRGEVDYREVWAAPSPAVVAALRGADDVLALCEGELPTAP